MRIPARAVLATRRLVFALALTGSAAVATAQPDVEADTILANGRIYTVDSAQPWAESVAIRDGRIVAVGTAAHAARFKGDASRVIDLGGRLVLPAFGDAHAHPLFGGLSRTRCPLHAGKSIAEYQAMIARCLADTPGDGPLFGVGWEDALFPPNGVPHKRYLDAISTSRALIFKSVGGHTYWVNSKALALAGITHQTPDPPNGTIDRDPETGEAVGSLQEAAQNLVEPLVPPPTEHEMQEAIVYVARHFNSLGIVGWNDAGVDYDDQGGSAMIDAYRAVMDAGRLTAYVTVSLTWQNGRGLAQLPGLLRAVERGNAIGVPTHTVKFYVDGVIPQQTAYMIAPYQDSHGHGTSQIDPDTLAQAVTAVDGHGLHAFLHAIGDGAVRISLDAIEAARAANGARPTHHMVTHLNVVDPADQPRFGALGVFAQFQPTWSSWYPYMELTEAAIGPERMRHIYPAGSIVRAGGKLAYGADWPVATANPLEGLEVAVTRRAAGDPDARPLVESEGVSLAEAIESHTLNVARVNGLEDVTGSIVAGKSVDLVVLDRNIFELPVHEISGTKVLVTLFRGAAVHGDLRSLAR